jgi:hypothetical protein
MSDDPNIVWENTLDGGTWGCKVVRTDEYRGRLTAWNVVTGKVILDQEVALAYDAIFGPDIYDLGNWQNQVIEAVDAQTQDGVTQ